MNEQEQVSQLSALFDGELPPEQAGMVIRRALKDSSLRTTWGRYALIGACVRGEPIGAALPQTDLAARVRARIAAEAEHTAAASSAAAVADAARRRSLFARGALGGAIAAGVAAVSLVVVRMTGTAALPVATQVAQQAPAPAAASDRLVANNDVRAARPAVARETSLPSYTTPVDDSPSRRNAPLVSYVVAHNDVAASVVRLAPLSSVMNGSYDLTQDAVEITAEAGARR
jgi:negative regulator of sigma E activity